MLATSNSSTESISTGGGWDGGSPKFGFNRDACMEHWVKLVQRRLQIQMVGGAVGCQNPERSNVARLQLPGRVSFQPDVGCA